MDIFARDARAMAKMREGVPLTAYGASGTVGLDDAGGGMVGIGHAREAYAKNPSDE
jgi:hypothetical protein